MAADGDFTKPDWNNPIDTDLDAIRDMQNFLLCIAASGASVAPGWQTTVDISTGDSYAEPDAVMLTRGTRAIRIKTTWE